MAQFFVNRGGGRVPEGPFEEQQIIALIRAGKLRSGYVCELGRQRFILLASHPPFAQALTEAAQAAPPGAGGEIPSLPRSSLAIARKPPSRGFLLGAVLAFLGLVLAIGATSAYILFNNGGMPARGAMPVDTELFVEVASVRQLTADLSTVRVLDSSKLQQQQLLSDAVADLSATFGVSTVGAEALLLAATSFGIGQRQRGDLSEGGILLTFSSASPVNSFLQSKRFTYTGLVSTTGRKYQLAAGAPGADASASPTRRALTSLQLGSAPPLLVWFETSKVLFLGSTAFADEVAQVVSLSAPSIERSPGFREALRDFSDQPNVIGYFDASKLANTSDPRAKSLVLDYFKSAGPATASVRLAPAGLVTHMVGRFTGAELTNRAPPAAPLPLTVIDRLPVETIAYAAAVTKSGLSGADMKQLLLDQVTKTDAGTAEQLRIGMTQLEERFHVRVDQVLGSIGDQAAVALLAPPDYRVALAAPKQMLANFALIYAQALTDDAPARALLKQIKTELGPLAGKFTIAEDASGYKITLNDDSLPVRAELRFMNGYLYLALGNAALVERSGRAFSAGERTITTDAAHRAARAALPAAAHVFAWVDTGRIAGAVLQNPLLASQVGKLGLANPAIRLSGPDRATLALSLTAEAKNSVYTYRIDTLNLPAFAGLAGLSGLTALTSASASQLLSPFP